MTITQTEAIELLATDLDYVDRDDTLLTLNLTHYHQQMFDHYLGLTPKQRKSLKQLDNIFVNLIGHIQSNLHTLDLHKYDNLTNVIDTIKGCKRDPTLLRVCLYQLLALSVKLELLAIIYLTSQTN